VVALLALGVWASWEKSAADQGETSAVAGTAEDGNSRAGAVLIPAGDPYIRPADLPPFQQAVESRGAISRRPQIQTTIPQRPRIEIVKYQVQQGDTLFGIAERFGLKPETVLWGNFDLLQDNPHSLRPGQDLNILPVDGTYYEWNGSDGLNVGGGFLWRHCAGYH
jgi:LysM repeat protein